MTITLVILRPGNIEGERKPAAPQDVRIRFPVAATDGLQSGIKNGVALITTLRGDRSG